jgi:hypothetical protein
MDSRLSGFSDFACADACRAHAYALPGARYHRAHRPQIRIPAATPRVVGVAHDISVARPFAAVLTLQCHNSSTFHLIEIADH